MRELRQILDRFARPHAFPAALATLVHTQGSSYRRAGARLLVPASGARLGSISGGCLEEDLLTRCRSVTEQRKPQCVVYDTTSENDLVWGVGLGCHGIVTVLIEFVPEAPSWAERVRQGWLQRETTQLATTFRPCPEAQWGTRWLDPSDRADPVPGRFVDRIPPPLSLLVFGAGDDAQPLVRIAAEFGWEISVIDPRPAYATRERFPLADHVHAGALDEILRALPTDERTAAVVMTHHYIHDLPILRALVRQPLGYLGLLGPRRRAEKLLSDLGSSGCEFAPSDIARLHAPVGLDLGGDTPESVAVSVVAEIHAVFNRRSARPLRERDRPIHAPSADGAIPTR